MVEDKSSEVLIKYETHLKRLDIVARQFIDNTKMISHLSQIIVNSLIYAGFDMQAKEIVDTHNETMENVKENLEDFNEVIGDLRLDMVEFVLYEKEIVSEYIDKIEEFEEETKKFETLLSFLEKNNG